MVGIGPGACEIRVRDSTGAYRVIYVAKFTDAVYVLHAFQKKSQKTTRAILTWQSSDIGSHARSPKE